MTQYIDWLLAHIESDNLASEIYLLTPVGLTQSCMTLNSNSSLLIGFQSPELKSLLTFNNSLYDFSSSVNLLKNRSSLILAFASLAFITLLFDGFFDHIHSAKNIIAR